MENEGKWTFRWDKATTRSNEAAKEMISEQKRTTNKALRATSNFTPGSFNKWYEGQVVSLINDGAIIDQ
jgi:predicted ATP-binding protein involved in virulence